MTITRRIAGALCHANIHRYEPLRVWLSPIDYCELMHYCPPDHEHDPITIEGVPISLDVLTGHTRLVLTDGHRIWF